MEEVVVDETVFTPAQTRLWSVLRDYALHETDELVSAMLDAQASPQTMRVYLSYIRKKLRQQEHDVMTHRKPGKVAYQLVRLRTNYVH